MITEAVMLIFGFAIGVVITTIWFEYQYAPIFAYAQASMELSKLRDNEGNLP